jgi:DNA-binding transcriptional MerR regulator
VQVSIEEHSIPTMPAEMVDPGAILPEGAAAMNAERRAGTDPLLSIGTFARRSRLSMKALRLYDRLGLLAPTHVDEGSGYRWYRESQLPTARLVALLRRLDMPLARVAEVMSAAGPPRSELVASYWESVERRIASQRELAAHLRIRLLGEERSFGMFEIQQREVSEQTVLTDRRHLLVDELPNWIAATMGRLLQSAEAYGGVVGAPFVVYHGEVNQDSDGPVEVCVPVGVAPQGSTDSAIRLEPAHSEAYVRVVKAQVEYPQILSAYDAVAQWIGSNGRTVSGSPREVYFTDWNAAGPGDEVCDVAFPMR